MKPETFVDKIKTADVNHLLEWSDLDNYIETDEWYQFTISTKSNYDLNDIGEFIDPQMQELSEKLYELGDDRESLLEWKHILYNFWIYK